MEEYGLGECFDTKCSSCHPTIDAALGKQISEDFAEYYRNSVLINPTKCIEAYIANRVPVKRHPLITDQMVKDYLLDLYNVIVDQVIEKAIDDPDYLC